jgi:serine phosphatase RsbU (regulator of sigma subunit)/anti-sigma regulatory factor (Ser/Thr protein kinase)/CHASE3 domain sensor protein
MTPPATSASQPRLVAPVPAMALAAATLLLALAAGMYGMWQLRDAVTFERRAIHLVGLRAGTLRLQLDEDTQVREFAATRRPAFLRQYRATDRELVAALATLRDATLDMNIAGGPDLVAAMQKLHAAWRATVVPLVGRPHTPAQTHSLERRRNAILDEFRRSSDKLVFAIAARIKRDVDSTESQLAFIAMSFVCALVLCGVSIAFVARRQLQIGRERLIAQTAVRERDLLFEQARIWSRSFQRAILPPRLPTVLGCAFDAVYEVGMNDAHVGGDWYDAVRLVDGRILVSIGDVAGSGLEAAVVMGTVRQIMRGIAQVHANPALMLDAADRALQLEYADIYVTAWVGVLDLVTRTLTFASAGHPPPLLAERTGNVRELSGTALPLGLRQGHQALPSTVALNDGSTLVLYTDGLSEATHDVLAGSQRVHEATAAIALVSDPRPATAIARSVLAQSAVDDVAILVVRLNFDEVERHIERIGFRLDDAARAHAARDAFIASLARHGFSMAEQFNAELVFGELIANVVRHAVGSDSVEIAVDGSGPQIVLHVLDRGPGFRHISRLPSDPYSESGRGLFLIAAMTDDFTVNERPDGGSHARAVFVSGAARPLSCEPAQFPAFEPGLHVVDRR